MMARSSAHATMASAQRLDPSALGILVVVTITSGLGLFGAIALASRPGDRSPLEQGFHVAISTLAVIGAWLLVHTQFALHYATLYYDETPADRPRASGGDGTVVAFRQGLAFPNAEVVDYWDFLYYSFTIAMCYQTSDVTITAPAMRRVTLAHALISFAFVLFLLGFIVNALDTLL
jgi:uncharacterized membrane protein